MYPQNFEEACTRTGENATDEKFSSGTSDEIAYKKLKVITAAINIEDNDGKEWEADWDDSDIEKWHAWWDMEVDKNNPSGFRFLLSGYDHTLSNTPSRLCYKSEAGLEHSAKIFLAEWKAFISTRK